MQERVDYEEAAATPYVLVRITANHAHDGQNNRYSSSGVAAVDGNVEEPSTDGDKPSDTRSV